MIGAYSATARLLVLGVAVLFLFGLGVAVGLKWHAGEVADLRIEHAETLRELADKSADAADKARLAVEAVRASEHEQAHKFVGIAEVHHQELTHVQAEADALVGDLRAGNRRLRQQWAACLTSTAEAAAGAGGPDAGADLRQADVGRVYEIAGQCDSHVRSLQAILAAERTEPAP